MADPFLTALIEWLNTISPPGLRFEVDEVSDNYVEVNGHGAWLWPEHRRSQGETAVRLATWILGWVQDDVAEDVSWGTPWPASPDGHELPSPEVEIAPDGVFVGYVDRAGRVAGSPKLPLPERWVDQSLGG